MLSLHTLALNQGHRVNGAPHKLCRTLSILRLPCIPHWNYHSASFSICAKYRTSCSLHNPQCVDFICSPSQEGTCILSAFLWSGQFLMLMASESRMGRVLKFSPVPDRTLVFRVPGPLLFELWGRRGCGSCGTRTLSRCWLLSFGSCGRCGPSPGGFSIITVIVIRYR